MIKAINTISDVEQFAKHLVQVEKLSFHPDDDFKDYLTNSNQPFYTAQEAELRNKLMNDCFEVCEREKVDVYGVVLSILKDEILLCN
jgi:hypothetical protein